MKCAGVFIHSLLTIIVLNMKCAGVFKAPIDGTFFFQASNFILELDVR